MTLTRKSSVLLLALLSACGRMGFEVLSDQLPDPSAPSTPERDGSIDEGPSDSGMDPEPSRDAMSDERDASAGETDAMPSDAEAACDGACATCSDGILNQDETDVDCGGASCSACATCSDGLLNQDEIYVDCGGSSCGPCPACTGSFGQPERITGLDLTEQLYAPSLSADMRTLFFARGGGVRADMVFATRNDRGPHFSGEKSISELNSAGYEGNPVISFDGLTLYFVTDRTGTRGDRDLVYATRSTVTSSFGALQWLTSINSESSDQTPTMSLDERTIIFASQRAGGKGGFDLWMAQRPSKGDPFAEAVNLDEINTAQGEAGPSLSSDGLTLFFASSAPGTLGGQDIWVTSRPDTASRFARATHLTTLSSSQTDQDMTISADGRELLFSSLRSGTRELWRVLRDCP